MVNLIAECTIIRNMDVSKKQQSKDLWRHLGSWAHPSDQQHCAASKTFSNKVTRKRVLTVKNHFSIIYFMITLTVQRSQNMTECHEVLIAEYLSDFLGLMKWKSELVSLLQRTIFDSHLSHRVRKQYQIAMAICVKIDILFEHHQMKLNFLFRSENVEARRRNRRQMFPAMIFGMAVLGVIIIPLGFNFLATIGGMALLFGKMALLIATITGIKRVIWNILSVFLECPNLSLATHFNESAWEANRIWCIESPDSAFVVFFIIFCLTLALDLIFQIDGWNRWFEPRSSFSFFWCS